MSTRTTPAPGNPAPGTLKIPAGLKVARVKYPGHNAAADTRALRVTFDRGRTRYVARLEIRTPGGDLSPGFSLTGEVYEPHGTWSGAAQQRNGREWDLGGAIGDDLAERLPLLAPFARLHLADLDGTPMHGPANAAYFLSGESDVYEARMYGPAYLNDHGDGYARACSILRVDSIPSACWTREGEEMVSSRRQGEGQAIVTRRDIVGVAWSAFVAELRELWAHEAGDAVACFDALWAVAIMRETAEILRTDNVTEPGGDWSAWDVARVLDPRAHTPRSMFDTGPDYPSDAWVRDAATAVAALDPPARYVGGTSGYLYSLPTDANPLEVSR